MSYGAVKTQFMAVLNRRDITPSLVDTFMGYAVQRIHTELRVPAMEKNITFTTDGSATIAVPGDLLQIISVHVNDDQNGRRKLTRTDLPTILCQSAIAGQPIYYHREGGNFYIGPYPPIGQTVYLNYYGDSSLLSADTDENWLTEVAPMLLVYAALSYAADYFLDDRQSIFEGRYGQIRDNLASMAMQDEVENASIRPAYNMDL